MKFCTFLLVLITFLLIKFFWSFQLNGSTNHLRKKSIEKNKDFLALSIPRNFCFFQHFFFSKLIVFSICTQKLFLKWRKKWKKVTARFNLVFSYGYSTKIASARNSKLLYMFICWCSFSEKLR